MISYRYSYTQTLSPKLYSRLESLYHGDIIKIINFCKYYFHMYLHDPKIIEEYYIIPEIFGLVDRKKPVTEENIKNVRLHFHGIIKVRDYNLFMMKIYSLKTKLGFNKLNYINCEDRFMKANNYLFKFQYRNPESIQWFSTYYNKLNDTIIKEIYNATHRQKRNEVIQEVTKDIMTYFQ